MLPRCDASAKARTAELVRTQKVISQYGYEPPGGNPLVDCEPASTDRALREAVSPVGTSADHSGRVLKTHEGSNLVGDGQGFADRCAVLPSIAGCHAPAAADLEEQARNRKKVEARPDRPQRRGAYGGDA